MKILKYTCRITAADISACKPDTMVQHVMQERMLGQRLTVQPTSGTFQDTEISGARAGLLYLFSVSWG